MFYKFYRSKIPQIQQYFYLNCDDSDSTVGAELDQLDEEENVEVIAFANKSISKAKRNNTVTE